MKDNKFRQFDQLDPFDDNNFYNDEYGDEYTCEEEEEEEESNFKFHNGISYGYNYYDFEIATILERGVAFAIDFVIFLFTHLFLIHVFKEGLVPYISSDFLILFCVLIIFSISCSFNGLFIPLFFGRGKTIGRSLVKIKITTEEGYDIGKLNLLMDFLLSFLFPINLVMIFKTDQEQTLSQFLNKNIVIRI